MIIKHKLKMEMTGMALPQRIEVMQHEQMSRILELSLQQNGIPAEVSPDCKVVIQYQKPDGQMHNYDTLDDGGDAWYISGNTIGATLLPEVCDTAGITILKFKIVEEEQILFTFPVEVSVKENFVTGMKKSAGYLSGFLPQPQDAKLGEYLSIEEIDGRGRVIRTRSVPMEATAGPEGASAYEIAVRQGFRGTEKEWLESLVGQQGPTGPTGATGEPGSQGADGVDGKSAYEYAKDGGYVGTEEEFAAKLAGESSGIHIGTDAPADEDVNVWIDTNEEPEEAPGSGSGIDVTAEVGQTIIVEEVDGNVKPTKWKAVEYQPRTHYSTYEEVQLLDNVTFIFGDEAFLDFFLVEGQSYRVIHNGTTYEEVAAAFNLDGISGSMIGNPAAVVGDDNGKPYAILTIDGMATQYMSMVGTDDTITLYTNQETIHEIPQKYLPDMRPYYVVISPDLDGDGTKMVTLEKVESFTVALATGRAIIAKVYSNDGGVQFIPLFSAVDSNNILLFNTYGGSATLFANDEGGYNVTVNFG